jgi:hypothetical protein
VSADSDANLSVDEDEKDMARYGHSAHRCSMIKKYTLESYFLGPSPSKRAREEVRPYLFVQSVPFSPIQPERDPSEVVLMKVTSTVEEGTEEEAKECERPTINQADAFQAMYGDEEESQTEIVPNRISKKFVTEDEDLTKLETL